MIWNLRGHHLGLLYEAVIKQQKTGLEIDDTINNIIQGLYFRNYPIQTLTTTKLILRQFFLDKKFTIKIVAGLDDICHAECIQDWGKQLADYQWDAEDEERKILNRIYSCSDKNAQGDLQMLKIFSMTKNCFYGRNFIMQSIERLAHEYNALNWRDLVNKYKSNQIHKN